MSCGRLEVLTDLLSLAENYQTTKDLTKLRADHVTVGKKLGQARAFCLHPSHAFAFASTSVRIRPSARPPARPPARPSARPPVKADALVGETVGTADGTALGGENQTIIS